MRPSVPIPISDVRSVVRVEKSLEGGIAFVHNVVMNRQPRPRPATAARRTLIRRKMTNVATLWGLPSSRDVLFRFLSEILVTIWAVCT